MLGQTRLKSYGCLIEIIKAKGRGFQYDSKPLALQASLRLTEKSLSVIRM